MKVVHQEAEQKGKFYLEQSGNEIAQMTYSKAGEKVMIIDHTEVNPEHRGKGLGEELLEALVEFVRKEQIKVLPLCPFAAAQFEKREDIRDVLK